MITLSNINNHTLQEIFDQVVDHLLTQGKKSIDKNIGSGNACAYRTSSGLSCAVGCLISDEEYSKSFEKRNVNELRHLLSESYGIQINTHIVDLLKKLQEIHDDFDPSTWEGSLKSLAFDQGLQFNYKAK